MNDSEKLSAARKRLEEEQRQWDMIEFSLRDSFKKGRDKRDDDLIDGISRTLFILGMIFWLLYILSCP